MKRIAFEEHFMTEDYLSYLRSRKDYPKRQIVEDEKGQKAEQACYSAPCCTVIKPDVTNRLIDMAEVRLQDMDKTGISMQVLSLSTPGVEAFEAQDGITWAKKTNDELARVVKKYPERFVGLAALPAQEPAAAASELERAVKELGFRGGNINSHVRGEYLDNKKYWPIFEKAEKLGIPIYIHPREPSPDLVKAYAGYPVLWSAMWGFGADTGLHAMRLICSGVFDEYPHLKIIIGHMGEALPFWIWRIDNTWQRSPMVGRVKRRPSQYLKDNFFITISGMFSQSALLCACLELGADNILFAVDYPYEANERGVQFMEAAPICDPDKEKIYHLNAERLLGL